MSLELPKNNQENSLGRTGRHIDCRNWGISKESQFSIVKPLAQLRNSLYVSVDVDPRRTGRGSPPALRPPLRPDPPPYPERPPRAGRGDGERAGRRGRGRGA